MKELWVKNQEELDKAVDFDGVVYIDFKGATLRRAYKYRVEAYENSYVKACGNSYVKACGNSYVEACGNSYVEAYGNSSVEACGNSYVEAHENSSVKACGNSYVKAYGNSYVEACGNVQVCDRTRSHKIKINGNARIVYMPKSIIEFLDFYGIKHTKTKATMYKAVHKREGKYFADYNVYEYKIGETFTEECDSDIKKDCGQGLHIAFLDWALRFGQAFSDLAILEVETKIADIVLPENSDGKVRTSRLKIIREVPLEECGVFGKILAKRKAK